MHAVTVQSTAVLNSVTVHCLEIQSNALHYNGAQWCSGEPVTVHCLETHFVTLYTGAQWSMVQWRASDSAWPRGTWQSRLDCSSSSHSSSRSEARRVTERGAPLLFWRTTVELLSTVKSLSTDESLSTIKLRSTVKCLSTIKSLSTVKLLSTVKTVNWQKFS